MNKYIFRAIFYTTIILSIFALGIDYDSLSFSLISILFGTIALGGVISYTELKSKSDKEVSELLGLPESFFKD